MKCDGDRRLLIVNKKNYCHFNIYVHYVEATIERIIWIAFYKNRDNEKCLIQTLSKDLVIYILYLLGKQSMTTPYIKI